MKKTILAFLLCIFPNLSFGQSLLYDQSHLDKLGIGQVEIGYAYDGYSATVESLSENGWTAEEQGAIRLHLTVLTTCLGYVNYLQLNTFLDSDLKKLEISEALLLLDYSVVAWALESAGVAERALMESELLARQTDERRKVANAYAAYFDGDEQAKAAVQEIIETCKRKESETRANFQTGS